MHLVDPLYHGIGHALVKIEPCISTIDLPFLDFLPFLEKKVDPHLRIERGLDPVLDLYHVNVIELLNLLL